MIGAARHRALFLELAPFCSPDVMRRGIERWLTSIARVQGPAHDGRLKTYRVIVRIGLFASVRSGPTGSRRPTKSAATIWRRCSLASAMSARPPLPISRCCIGRGYQPRENETLGRPYGSTIQDQERNGKAFEESRQWPGPPDGRQRHLRLERRAVGLPCPLHVLLPRYQRFLRAGLHRLSHFRDPAQLIAGRRVAEAAG
jgi:hypothetical protein